jgi:phosphoenolpyruvate carboxykinase (diphosphate)
MRFVHSFFGRVFNHPHAVFTEEMLKPELQDKEIFADGMDNIVGTQKRVAKMYFDDGSIAQACPPLQGAAAHHAPRRMGGEKSGRMRNSGNCSRAKTCWRAAGMPRGSRRKQKQFLRKPSHEDVARDLGVADRLKHARKVLEAVESPDYLKKLSGTLGVEPIAAYLAGTKI